MENLKLYEALRVVPDTAKRPIAAGRLKGKTDINPLYRIKALTEQFGPCGVGWKYEVTNKWLEPGAKGEIAAFVDINLYYRWEGKWSEPIPGTGGSAFVENERNGLYTSDECFKMALTDAISVACKALGVGADVYWENDRTKYDKRGSDDPKPAPQEKVACERCGAAVKPCKRNGKVLSVQETAEYSRERFGGVFCGECRKAALAAEELQNEAEQ